MILYIYPCTLFIFRHLILIQLLWESINELKKKKYNVEAICLLAKTKALRQGAKNSICRNCRCYAVKLYLPAISAFRISSLVLHHIHPCHLISGDFQRTEPSLQWRLCSMRWNLTNQSHLHKCLGNAPDSLVSKLNNCKCLALSTDWALRGEVNINSLSLLTIIIT